MIKAFGDYIVLKPIKVQESKAGIIVPEDSENKDFAEVVDAEIHSGIKILADGERVSYGAVKKEIKVKGETYLIVHKDEILAVLEE